MEKIRLICDANPKESVELQFDEYGLHISINSEDGYSEVQLKNKSVDYLIDFIEEIKQCAYNEGFEK